MKRIITSLIVMASICGFVFVALSPINVSAATGDECNRGFLGFPSWYKGLTNADCSIKTPTESGGLSIFIWHIALNIIEIALMAVGYITVFFIMYGGFMYLTSVGDPGELTKAKRTILNAIIGLVISFASVAVVNFVSGIIK